MFLGTLKEREVLENWRRRYKEIREDLPLSFEKDETAAHIASAFYSFQKISSRIELARKLISGKEVSIVGASEEADLYSPGGEIVIGVEGGAGALISRGIFPHVIVTDLDGPIELLKKSKFSMFFVHFHGDNYWKVWKAPSELISTSVPTVQTWPFGNTINLGGFTDGDRAAYLAALLGARKIKLVAFDFTREGKYSYPSNKKIKLKKLKWAEVMLEDLDRIFGGILKWE